MSEKKLRCIFCNELTDDYWFSDLGTGECRCRVCQSKGILETEREKERNKTFQYMPVKNRDFFSSEFLQEKKSQGKKFDHDRHVIRFAPQGSLIEFSPRLCDRRVFSNSRPRGEIVAFSRRSRSRLNKKIAMLRRGVLPLFVTLTYHQEIPQDFEGYKHQLDHFFIRLLQRFPKAGVMWKLEYQFRGYAHFHLFVWGVSEDQLKDFVPAVWNGIAGYGSDDHLKWHQGLLGNGNKHCVQAVRSWNGVMSYASKYFAKVDNDKVGGRVWGLRGSHVEISSTGKKIRVSNIPFSKILEFSCSLDVALEFRKVLAEELNFQFQRLGFWCANYHPDWLIFFDDLQTSEYVSNHPPEDFPDWDLFLSDYQEA